MELVIRCVVVGVEDATNVNMAGCAKGDEYIRAMRRKDKPRRGRDCCRRGCHSVE
jgi:hypothetical protein